MAPGPVTYGPPSLPPPPSSFRMYTLLSRLVSSPRPGFSFSFHPRSFSVETHPLPHRRCNRYLRGRGRGGRRRVFNLHPQATRSTLPLPPHLCARSNPYSATTCIIRSLSHLHWHPAVQRMAPKLQYGFYCKPSCVSSWSSHSAYRCTVKLKRAFKIRAPRRVVKTQHARGMP